MMFPLFGLKHLRSHTKNRQSVESMDDTSKGYPALVVVSIGEKMHKINTLK